MTDQTKATRRDEVLFAFHRDCTRPTADQIIDWTRRYPEFADDIRAHAAIIRDSAANEGAAEEDVDELWMNRANSRALNAIYTAQAAAQSAADPDSDLTFDRLMADAGFATPQLSRALDIGREVLSDLFRGRMRPPIGQRLVAALMEKLHATQAQFDHALARAMARPSVGHARATHQPTVVQRSYEEVVRSSSMSPERMSYWLDEG
jgi:hypothetical protein